MDLPQVLPQDLPPVENTSVTAMREAIESHKRLQATILRDKGPEDLFVFNKFVLEVEKGKVPLVDFHRKLCNFVTDNKKRKKLILIPRGHLKSTLITIGYCVQQIVKNPNIRILILNATWQMSVDFLTEIKRQLGSNEKLIELFGNHMENLEENSQDRLTIKRTDQGIKGPTVWATGIDSNLVGSHPDMIIFDDVVNRDNTMTQEQIDKVKLRYKDALDLLEPGGQLIVIGTRWTQNDLYSWLMDKDQGLRASYEIMVERAYTGDIKSGEGFQALWPEKFDLKELQDRLREKGWYEFSSQYLNNPIPSEDADFKSEWFQYYDLEDYRGATMRTVMTVDPAISLAKEADYTAIDILSIDQFGNIFVKDLARGHWKPNEIIEKIFYLNEMWHPDFVVLETVAYQKALAYALNDEMRRRNRHLPIQEIRAQEMSKDQRIKGLQPVYESRKVFHRKAIPLMSYFEEELTSFPRGSHDDMIDAFSMALTYLNPPKPKHTRFQHRYLY